MSFILFVGPCFGATWKYTSSSDELTDEVTTSALAFDFSYKYSYDFTIGFQCTNNKVRFIVGVDTLIEVKGDEFNFSYRVDKRPANSLRMNVYSNDNQGGYTINHAKTVAENILGGNSIFVRVITWNNDYLETTIRLDGSDAVIKKVFNDCGVELIRLKPAISAEESQAAAREKAKTEATRERKREGGRQDLSEAGTALQLASGAIQAAIRSNWIEPPISTTGLEALIRINVNPGGEVTSAQVVKSSGNSLFDRSAEIAVLKASPIPIPNNPKYYQFIKEFNINFRPNG